MDAQILFSCKYSIREFGHTIKTGSSGIPIPSLSLSPEHIRQQRKLHLQITANGKVNRLLKNWKILHRSRTNSISRHNLVSSSYTGLISICMRIVGGSSRITYGRATARSSQQPLQTDLYSVVSAWPFSSLVDQLSAMNMDMTLTWPLISNCEERGSEGVMRQPRVSMAATRTTDLNGSIAIRPWVVNDVRLILILPPRS